MEKDNKKSRDDARKEYIEAVRVCSLFPTMVPILIDHPRQDLVRFLRKRDQRYKDHLSKQAARAKSALSSGPSKQHQQTVPKYIEQDWQRVDYKYEDNEAGE